MELERPSSRAPAFDCSVLLLSSNHRLSKLKGKGRFQDQCGRPSSSESGSGLSFALKALPGCIAFLLCARTLATLDYFPFPNSLCTLMSRLFLLSAVACLPLLSLPDAIPDLQGLALPEDTFLRPAPPSAFPQYFVHLRHSVAGRCVSLARLWLLGSQWRSYNFFFCYCLVLSRCCRIELGHMILNFHVIEFNEETEDHKQEVTWPGSWDKLLQS